VLVTNNEVSEHEAEGLRDKGFEPGDPEWDELGIAQYVTWPRTKCSITGKDIHDQLIQGDYLISDDFSIPMSDGFKANAAFFKLGFLDKTAVALGLQFKELLSTLWLKAGAIGECPELESEGLPDMLILPQNEFAVLINENEFAQFIDKVKDTNEIRTVYLITDYEVNYRAMAKELYGKKTYQLYRDYLDNFRINRGRN
jgi:adenine-specific DNA-methyltransferase